MPLKCVCLNEEYLGADSAVVCRQAIAKAKGYQCPRSRNRWTVARSCFNLPSLFNKRREVIMTQLHPSTAAIFGTGEPTEVINLG